MVRKIVRRLGDEDEIDRYQPRALMEKLMEGVLSIGPRPSPQDRAGGIVDGPTVAVGALAVALHVELLKVIDEPVETLVIGQDGAALGAEMALVPDPEKPQKCRHVACERRALEMAVHGVRAVEQALEIAPAEPEREHEPDRRPQRIAPADPVPEAEHVGRIDAEGAHRGLVGRDGDEMPGHRRLVAQPREEPVARRAGVDHGLEGGEGLRGDDEERCLRADPLEHRRQVIAVEIGDEMHRDVRPPIGLERFHRGLRAEMRAADADIDDVPDRGPGGAAPGAGVHALHEIAHPLELGPHRGHDIAAGDRKGALGAVAQGDMKRRPPFGEIDRLAGEHAPPPALEIGGAGEREEPSPGLFVGAVLRIVEHEPVRRERISRRTARIGGEEIAHVNMPQRRRLLGQRAPLRTVAQDRHRKKGLPLHIPPRAGA